MADDGNHWGRHWHHWLPAPPDHRRHRRLQVELCQEVPSGGRPPLILVDCLSLQPCLRPCQHRHRRPHQPQCRWFRNTGADQLSQWNDDPAVVQHQDLPGQVCLLCPGSWCWSSSWTGGPNDPPWQVFSHQKDDQKTNTNDNPPCQHDRSSPLPVPDQDQLAALPGLAQQVPQLL